MQEVKFKVPGGKLIRLKAVKNDGKLSSVTLAGDFFLMPSEGITHVEQALEGFSLQDIGGLQEVLDYVVRREGIRLSGIGTQDIVKAVQMLGDAA